MSEALKRIYDGNTKVPRELAAKFVKDYKKLIFKAADAKIDAILGIDLQNAADVGAETSSGMVQWSSGELMLLSSFAFEWLAAFLM